MKYEKPSVVVLATAAKVIQGTGQKSGLVADADPSQFPTIAAYEADE